MKFNNVSEMAKNYYPTIEEVELVALRNFIRECYHFELIKHTETMKYWSTIYDALVRADVRSIADLQKVNLYKLAVTSKQFGPRKLELALQLQQIINDNIKES